MEDAAPLPVVMAVVRGDADTGILSAATTTAQTYAVAFLLYLAVRKEGLLSAESGNTIACP